MRLKVKRRLFLLSMAMATGTAGPAIAKGGGKMEVDAAFDVQERYGAHVSSMPDAEIEGGNTSTTTMFFTKLKSMFRELNYGSGVSTLPTESKGWRLEMLQADTKPDHASDPRLLQDKRFGMALRMAF